MVSKRGYLNELSNKLIYCKNENEFEKLNNLYIMEI